MFFESEEIKKEIKKKIGIIHNGKNAKEVISDAIKFSNITLIAAPKENQNEFIIEFNSHKGKNGRIKKSVFDMQEISDDLNNYVLIHKDDYESFLKFQKKNNRALDLEQQGRIKESYKEGMSQRKIAKDF